MARRKLIAGTLLTVWGAGRSVIDVLGAADVIHSLLDPQTWLYGYAPLLSGLALIVWAVIPSRKTKSSPPANNGSAGISVGSSSNIRVYGNRIIRSGVGVEITDCEDVSAFDNTVVDPTATGSDTDKT